MAHDTDQLRAEMKARVDAILADPEVGGDVLHRIAKAGVEVAVGHLIKSVIADFFTPSERAFGGGGVLDRGIDGKFTEKIPRPHTSVIRFM